MAAIDNSSYNGRLITAQDCLYVIPDSNSAALFLKKTLTEYEKKFKIKEVTYVEVNKGFYIVNYIGEANDSTMEKFYVTIAEPVSEIERYRVMFLFYCKNYTSDLKNRYGDLLRELLEN